MKRWMMLILLAIMLLAQLPVTSYAADSPSVTIGSGIAAPGQTVEVPVTISENAGFVSLGIQIAYNSNVLTLESVMTNTVGGSYMSSQNYAANPYVMTWQTGGRSNLTYSGVLATLRFSVKSGAAEGNYPLTIGYYTGPRNNYEDDVDVNFDVNYKSLGLTYVSGSVLVKNTTVGAAVGTMGDGQEIAWRCDQASGMMTVAGPISTNAVILVASYDASGRMLSIDCVVVSGEDAKFDKDSKTVKVFWVTGNGAPKCLNGEVKNK